MGLFHSRLITPPPSVPDPTTPVLEWTPKQVADWFRSRAVPAYSDQVLVFDSHGKCTALYEYFEEHGHRKVQIKPNRKYVITTIYKPPLATVAHVHVRDYYYDHDSCKLILNPHTDIFQSTWDARIYIEHVHAILFSDWFTRGDAYRGSSLWVFDKFGKRENVVIFRTTRTYTKLMHVNMVHCKETGESTFAFLDDGCFVCVSGVLVNIQWPIARKYKAMVERNLQLAAWCGVVQNGSGNGFEGNVNARVASFL